MSHSVLKSEENYNKAYPHGSPREMGRYVMFLPSPKIFYEDINLYLHTVDMIIDNCQVKNVCVDGGATCNVMVPSLYDCTQPQMH